MTVAEYSEKYGITKRAIYHAIYASRISCDRVFGKIDILDIPPPPSARIRQPEELRSLPDYILALIWFSGTISGDAILIRNIDRYCIDAIRQHIKASTWRSETPDGRERFLCKISGVELVQALRDMGFTGIKDAARQQPPVPELPFAKAFTELHTSFVWQLRYNRRYPRDKRYASYAPCIALCASVPVLDAYAGALCELGIAPPRKVGTAANGTSAAMRYTSNAQLREMHHQLSPDLGSGTHAAFWDAFDRHISQPPIPYFVKAGQGDGEKK